MTDSDSPTIPRRQCPKCKNFFPLTKDYFHICNRKPGGFASHCKSCRNAAQRKPVTEEPIPDGFKRCTKCKGIFPATPEFFYKTPLQKSGFRSWCKACLKRGRPPDLEHIGQKQCTLCLEWKSATTEFFYADKRGKYGLFARCKKCLSHYNVEIYEQRKPYLQHYKKTHADELRLYFHHHHQIHRERRRIQSQQWYQAHKEQMRLYKQQYHRTHLEQARMAHHNRRARKKSVPGMHTDTQIMEQLQRQHYRCYYAACGFARFKRVRKHGKWEYDYHVEHTFPLSRVVGTGIPANDMGYIVLACPTCNDSKGTKYPWEWPEGGRLL